MKSSLDRGESLRKRILVPLIITSAVLLGLLGLIIHKQVEAQLVDNVEQRSQLVANSIGYAIDTVGSEGALHRYVSSIGAQREVESIFVAAGDPLKILATTSHKLRGAFVGDLEDEFLRESLVAASLARSKKIALFKKQSKVVYAEPIHVGALSPGDGLGSNGAVFVVLGLDYFDEQLEKQFNSALIYGALMLLLVSAVAFALLSNRVVEPLKKIIAAVDKRGSNQLLNVSQMLARDEIGRLARILEEAFEKEISSSSQMRAFARDVKFQKDALDAHAIVSEADAKGRITYVNDGFCQVSGYSMEELIGQDHRIVNSGFHDKSFFREIYRAFKEIGHWNGEICNRSKEGAEYWVDSTIVAFKDESGRIVRYVSIRYDITKRKNAEIELIEAHETVEQSLLAENAARRDAESAANAKSQFLATMSHEIRTPMNGLIGVLHLLEEGISEEKLKLLDTAQNSARDLLVLINDILDFSKIEAGKMALERVEFDALDLIEEIGDLHAPSAHEKGLEFICMGEPMATFKTWGDPLRLRQIVSNLVSNSIKFTQRGEVAIGLRYLKGEGERDFWRFEVKDTGVGIAPESQEALFESFSQANSSTTRKFGGTGLGLAICKKLVELMDGRIGLDSQVDVGSTFWFEIPYFPGSALEADGRTIDAVSGKRAMVIDGNPSIRRQVSLWLEYWGCQVRTEASLEKALDALRNSDDDAHFDFILIDQNRLVLHNELWSQVRNNWEAFRDSKVIVMNRVIGEIKRLSDSEVLIGKPIRNYDLRNAMTGIESITLAPRVSHSGVAVQRCESLKALLADDNPTNRMIAKALMEQRHGFVPDEASNGKEAVDLVSKNKYEIIFMDCMMPEMDGYEATQLIRAGQAGDSNKEIPIIALTANAMEGDRERCLDAGMSDYLTKPLVPKSLAAMIGKWQGIDESFQDDRSEQKNTDPGKAIFDLSSMADMFDGDQDVIQSLVDTYKNSLRETLGHLERSIEDGGGIEQIRLYSHSIKGSSWEFGALKLSEEAKRMEAACIDGELEVAVSIFSNLKELSEQTLVAIKEQGY